MSCSVAITFNSFSPFRTSRTRSVLNLALKFLLVRDIIESSMLVNSSISDSLKNASKKCLNLWNHYTPPVGQLYLTINRANKRLLKSVGDL